MSSPRPTLDILICTIGNGLDRVPSMLPPPTEGVRYIVSAQYEDSPTVIPQEISGRDDVTVDLIPGKGLSRNRNNALRLASSDICLIADDDSRYRPEFIETILSSWQENPQADILTFQAQTLEGEPLHPYPADYVCSIERTFRRTSITQRGIRFNERFGLGSPLLSAGEEDVFMADARKAGLNICYIPKVIVQTQARTTGTRFLEDPRIQVTKGATFRYVYGTYSAVWRSFKEAGWYLVHRHVNPLPILFNMLKGIWILR